MSQCTKRLFLRALLIAAPILTLFNSPVRAAENGFSNFPWGAQTTYAAHMPPPGETAFFGYTLYFDANSVRDNEGDKIPGVSFDLVALAPRVVYTWKPAFYGWNMTSGTVIQGVYVDLKVPGARDDHTSPSLLGIEPLYLSKTFGAWTFLHGPLIYLKLGNYDRNRVANSSLNYNSYAYQGSLSWNPSPRLDVSLNAAIEYKEKNSDTDYRSGTQAGLTFGTGYKPFADQRWDFGFSGFYTDGVTDDKINGVKVPGGGRSKQLAVGPKLVYWINPGAAIVAQWHHEFIAENAPQGDLFWLECTFPL